MANIQESEKFKDEIWLELGGDSTKLCFQIANVADGNSAELTQMLSFFEATVIAIRGKCFPFTLTSLLNLKLFTVQKVS